MESFFSGLIVLLYMTSRYAAEYVFVVSCLFPICFVLFLSVFLHFGAQGRLVAAYRRAKKRLRNGVVCGNDRTAFRDVCLKGAPASLRFAFSSFAEGDLSSFDLAEKAKSSVKDKRALCFGAYFGLSIASDLLVFLCFYFDSTLNEAFLRFALSAFFLSINAAILYFITYGYAGASERAAVGLAELLNEKVLRVKKKSLSEYPSLRYKGSDFGSEALKEERTRGESESEKEKRENFAGEDLASDGVARLRRILKEIDSPNA